MIFKTFFFILNIYFLKNYSTAYQLGLIQIK
jgi:hypothetical protein